MTTTPDVVTLMNDLEISADEAKRLLDIVGGDADKAMYNYSPSIAPPLQEQKPKRSRKPKKPATLQPVPKPSPALARSAHVTTVANLLSAMDLTDAERELYGAQIQTPKRGQHMGAIESFRSYLIYVGLKHRTRRRGPPLPPAYMQYIDMGAAGAPRDDAQPRSDARKARKIKQAGLSPGHLPQANQDGADVRKSVGAQQKLTSQSDISKMDSQPTAHTIAGIRTVHIDKNVFRRLAAQDRARKILTLEGSADPEAYGTTTDSNTPTPSSLLPQPTQKAPQSAERLPIYISIDTIELSSTPIDDSNQHGLDAASDSTRPDLIRYRLMQRRYNTLFPYDEVLKTFNTLGAAKQELKTLTERHCRAKWVKNEEGKMVSERPLYLLAEDGLGFAIKARGGAVELRVWIAQKQGTGHQTIAKSVKESDER